MLSFHLIEESCSKHYISTMFLLFGLTKNYPSGFFTPFFLRWGQGPPQFFFRGGFSTPGASLGQISILKIIIFWWFCCYFLVYSYYVASLNDTNRVRNVYIIYNDFILDVPKHSSEGGLNSLLSKSPPWILKIQHPWALDGQIFC